VRFRIIELILFVSATALTITCLIKPDELHETIYFSFVLIAIVLSIAMAIGRAKAQRSFWIGFSVVSIGYLSLAHVPDAAEYSPRQSGPEFTTQLLEWAFYEAVDVQFDDPFSFFSPHQQDPFADGDEGGVDDPFADDVSGGLEGGLEGPGTNDPPTRISFDDPFRDDADSDLQSPLPDDDKEEHEEEGWIDTGMGLGTIQAFSATTICVAGSDAGSFFRIGHSAWALLLGWFAGHLAQFIFCKTHSIP